MGLELGRTLEGRRLFRRHDGELFFQVGHAGGHAGFEGLPGAGQLLLDVGASRHQGAPGHRGSRRGRRGGRAQGGAVGGEHGGIEGDRFWRAGLGPGRSSGLGRG